MSYYEKKEYWIILVISATVTFILMKLFEG